MTCQRVTSVLAGRVPFARRCSFDRREVPEFFFAVVLAAYVEPRPVASPPLAVARQQDPLEHANSETLLSPLE